MTIKLHNGMCPWVQVLQEDDDMGRDTISAKNLPWAILVDIVVNLGEVNEG
jgi:hypothetical protein